MKVNIKKLNKKATIPTYSKYGDAGMDLTAISKTIDKYGNIVYGTGLSIEIPDGFVALLFPRSSIAKYDLSLTNCVGVIDSGYRGEIMVKFKYVYSSLKEYSIGDRVCQMMIIPYPQIEFQEVVDISKTERGDGGFGSTGK